MEPGGATIQAPAELTVRRLEVPRTAGRADVCVVVVGVVVGAGGFQSCAVTQNL